MPYPSDKIGDLQVLRGVSVLLILHNHLPLPLQDLLPIKCLPATWLGVEIFFVMSGYVITQSLLRSRFEPLSFMVRRAFRLLPALLACIAFGSAVNLCLSDYQVPLSASTTVPWDEFVESAVYIIFAVYMFAPAMYMFAPMWSLSVEDQFYTAIGVISLLTSLLFRRCAQRMIPALIFSAAATLYGYALFLRVDCLCHGKELVRAGAIWNHLVGYRFDFLALGVLAAFADARFRNRIATWIGDRGPFLSPILFMIPFFLASLTGDGQFLRTRHLTGLTMPVAGVCFAFLVLIAAHDTMTPPTRGAAYRLLYYVGDRSYSLYLFHVPVYLVGWYVLNRIDPRLHTTDEIRHGFCLAVICAPPLFAIVEVVYRRIELPMAAAGRRLSDRLRILPTAKTEAVIIALPQRKAA